MDGALGSEILSGTAIAIVDGPECLRTAVSLQAAFEEHLAGTTASDIARVVLHAANEEAIDTSAKAIGAVEFYAVSAVETVLERVEMVSSGRVGALELRRGTLTLGPHKLLVEGIVPTAPVADAEQHAAQGNAPPRGEATPPLAPAGEGAVPLVAAADAPRTHTENATTEPEPQERDDDGDDNDAADPTQCPADHMATSQPTVQKAPADDVVPGHSSPQRSPSPVHSHGFLRVVLLDFRLLFSRHDAPEQPVTRAASRSFIRASDRAPLPPSVCRKDFSVSPLIVYQILRSAGHQPAAVRLCSPFAPQSGSSAPTCRFMAEFASHSAARRVVGELNGVITDLCSPVAPPTGRGEPSGRGGDGPSGAQHQQQQQPTPTSEAVLMLHVSLPFQLEKFEEWLETVPVREAASHTGGRGAGASVPAPRRFTGRLRRLVNDGRFLCAVHEDGTLFSAEQLRRTIGEPFPHAWGSSADATASHATRGVPSVSGTVAVRSSSHDGVPARCPPTSSSSASPSAAVAAAAPPRFLQPPAGVRPAGTPTPSLSNGPPAGSAARGRTAGAEDCAPSTSRLGRRGRHHSSSASSRSSSYSGSSASSQRHGSNDGPSRSREHDPSAHRRHHTHRRQRTSDNATPVPSLAAAHTPQPTSAEAASAAVFAAQQQQQQQQYQLQQMLSNPAMAAVASQLLTAAAATQAMPLPPYYMLGAQAQAPFVPPSPYLQFLQQQQQQQQLMLAMAAAQAHTQQQQQQPSLATPPASAPRPSAAVSGGPIPGSVATTQGVVKEVVVPLYGEFQDTKGALPQGWQAVYSDEYAQTYYVFHDPVSGQDTTTWTRPT